MPLPRLQKMGTASDEFIYDIGWDEAVVKKTFDRYVVGDNQAFDNRVRLKPRVGEYLLQLNGLPRPLIHRRWCAMVAKLNGFEDSKLQEFLFGIGRIMTLKVRPGLWEIQGKRCFYCGERLADPSKGDVDHSIPWARYPDKGIENLVVADTLCNGSKGSSLAAGEHVSRWATRLWSATGVAAQLEELASRTGWVRHTERTVNVARGIYFALPRTAKLWLRGKEFVAAEQEALRRALIRPTLGSTFRIAVDQSKLGKVAELKRGYNASDR